MASRKTCAITKALLRVRLSEGSATPASTICKLQARPQRSSALGSACRPLNAMRCMQGVRFYARLRDAPSRQPLQSAPAPSVSHDDEDDDDNDDDDDNHDDDDVEEKEDDADKGKEQKKVAAVEEEEDNHTFLFGKYDNNYSDDDTEDFYMPDFTSSDYDDD